MNSSAEKRFGWINGFINAFLNALFIDLEITGREYSSLTIPDFLTRYVNKMHERQSEHSSWPTIQKHNLNKKELNYLFQLESELWGEDYENYITFFPKPNRPHNSILQTFLFVHGFFLIERWLDLFIKGSGRISRKTGRLNKRKLLFGEKGFFIEKYSHLSMIMGYPANLCSTVSKIFPIYQVNDGWNIHKNSTIPNDLKQFYRSISNNKYCHYSEIIESALINSRKKLPRHIFPRKNTRELRKFCRRLRATWYDVLWIYSESFRYHPVCPSDYCFENPFYWNRTIRWLTSAIVTGLLFLIQKSLSDNKLLEDCWTRTKRRNPFFSQIFGVSRDMLS